MVMITANIENLMNMGFQFLKPFKENILLLNDLFVSKTTR